jgi:ectoine hydrolase
MSFTTAEYKERIRKTKERMAEKGIEVLLITDPANMHYLSGFDGWSFYVHQMLVLIIDEEQPLWVGREMDASAAKVTTWLYRENIIPYPEDYVQSETKHPMDFVADVLRQIGQENRCIGVEMENYYFTAKCFAQLKKGLPNCTFKDATLLVNWIRLIKSDAEIEYMKRAAKIVEKAMQTGLDMIDVGVRECDVTAAIYRAQISGTEEFGGDYPAIVPIMPAGEKTSAAHLTWTDERYKPGDSVFIEIAGCYKRYHSPLARTIQLGKPTEEMKTLSSYAIEGINACLDMIKPGIACEEIVETWVKTTAKSGIVKDSRMGYAMGLNYPPDWGENTVSIRKGDKTILQPNMTFHLMPGLWLDHFGFECSEAIRITENGCETLANFTRILTVKDYQSTK